jgi:hypothetical protein
MLSFTQYGNPMKVPAHPPWHSLTLREAGCSANRDLKNGFYTIRNVDASRQSETRENRENLGKHERVTPGERL